MAATNSSVGLVLQGGGARGAYQAGVLAAIAEILGNRQTPFSVISGTSVGAINAFPMAAGARNFQRAAQELEALWASIETSQVFETGTLAMAGCMARLALSLTGRRRLRGGPLYLFNNRPLAALLEARFSQEALRRALARGALDGVAISASRLGQGESVTFFQSRRPVAAWQSARRCAVPVTLDVPHVMASAALPIVFPPVALGANWYVDGALRLAAPLAPAIRLGAEKLLVISLRDAARPGLPAMTGTPPPPPSLGDLMGDALDILFNDNLEYDLEQLERINRSLRGMSAEARAESRYRPIEVLDIAPSRDMRDLAMDARAAMPRSVRMIVSLIGGFRRDSRLISYLLFEAEYTRRLIALGREDAFARRDEIKAFFE